MDFFMYVKAFAVGGAICVIGQILIDLTKLTPARILVCFVSVGVILTVCGVYEYIVDFAGAGATVPIVGFGYTLGKGVVKGLQQSGILGVFTGGVSAAAGGIAASVIFGYIIALMFSPKAK